VGTESEDGAAELEARRCGVEQKGNERRRRRREEEELPPCDQSRNKEGPF
jgi:hypothetical protein